MIREPSEEDLRAFIAEHWLDTQQSAAATASWFEALNARGWRFPTLSPELGGPHWSHHLRLKWVRLTHLYRTPADSVTFCNLVIPLLNQNSTSTELREALHELAALNWKIGAQSHLEPMRETNPGLGLVVLSADSQEAVSLEWTLGSSWRQCALSFDRPIEEVLRSVVDLPLIFELLLDTKARLEDTEALAAQQFVEQEIEESIAHLDIELTALIGTVTRLPTIDALKLAERAVAHTFRMDGLVRRVAGPYANTTSTPPGNFHFPFEGQALTEARQIVDCLTPWWLACLEYNARLPSRRSWVESAAASLHMRHDFHILPSTGSNGEGKRNDTLSIPHQRGHL